MRSRPPPLLWSINSYSFRRDSIFISPSATTVQKIYENPDRDCLATPYPYLYAVCRFPKNIKLMVVLGSRKFLSDKRTEQSLSCARRHKVAVINCLLRSVWKNHWDHLQLVQHVHSISCKQSAQKLVKFILQKASRLPVRSFPLRNSPIQKDIHTWETRV
jgi:hypothetical protein